MGWRRETDMIAFGAAQMRRIVSAYADPEVSVSQLAKRFRASPDRIKSVLEEHGVIIRGQRGVRKYAEARP
jgi:hypothetical protein